MTQTKRRPKTKPTEPSQAEAFITSMHNSGWRTINAWEDGGHTFELLGRNGKTILAQIYPEGHGFQVWRPVTESTSLEETRMAVEEYGFSGCLHDRLTEDGFCRGCGADRRGI